MSLRGLLGLFGLAALIAGEEPPLDVNHIIDDAGNDFVDDTGAYIVWG
jgi:hypothetical protein